MKDDSNVGGGGGGGGGMRKEEERFWKGYGLRCETRDENGCQEVFWVSEESQLLQAPFTQFLFRLGKIGFVLLSAVLLFFFSFVVVFV